LVDRCGYELPTNLQNFTQKDSTEVKIFQNVFWGATFLKHPVDLISRFHSSADYLTFWPIESCYSLVDLTIINF